MWGAGEGRAPTAKDQDLGQEVSVSELSLEGSWGFHLEGRESTLQA